ncbi:DUF1499 domain-containing protein [Roseibium album]|uniref:DUF1499 domain-containing protein n=1 Tax=Roseibium album TaxID=311410 RepID=UPI0032974396
MLERKMKHAGKIALTVAIVGAVCAALMLFGARLGLWEPTTGFGLSRNYLNPLGAMISGAGLIAMIVHIIRKEKGGAICGGVATLLGVVCLVPMITSTINPPVRSAPINDITTDTANPPAFLVLDDTREGARTSLEYAGAKVAEIQAAAHPDIAPLETDLAADAAYARALEVAQDMGWEIIASDAENHRFEATARTSVFYFADDVVVVVAELGSGSRVDMRSVSRVGRSDRGANAARIRDFQQQFEK